MFKSRPVPLFFLVPFFSIIFLTPLSSLFLLSLPFPLLRLRARHKGVLLALLLPGYMSHACLARRARVPLGRLCIGIGFGFLKTIPPAFSSPLYSPLLHPSYLPSLLLALFSLFFPLFSPHFFSFFSPLPPSLPLFLGILSSFLFSCFCMFVIVSCRSC